MWIIAAELIYHNIGPQLPEIDMRGCRENSAKLWQLGMSPIEILEDALDLWKLRSHNSVSIHTREQWEDTEMP